MKIGNLEVLGNVFLAPMAGITDPPFRKTVQRFGISALWTEMISAEGLVRGGANFPTMNLEDHTVPTVFQICGKDPFVMAEAARIVEERGASAVDVNMGCPSRKVVKKGSGAALMRDLPLAASIVRAVRRSVTISLTVKIRSGWDESSQNAPELARLLESEGADAIVLHSRCRSRAHSGEASLQMIREVRNTVTIPVIGNGGIRSEEGATTMIADTRCDGVMVGRGALGRPWLPGRILQGLGHEVPFERRTVPLIDVVRDHFQFHLDWWDVRTSVRRMRKHWGWYSKGFPGGTEFRQSIFRENDPSRVISSAEDFFGKVVVS
ncbi:MAG: tRNA dihydrouridine synthase DusB [Desulfomonilaceae bacterium]|nr:tRNA dihydrouridine synthase DusB [Desulfomonilaceae bacterium]